MTSSPTAICSPGRCPEDPALRACQRSHHHHPVRARGAADRCASGAAQWGASRASYLGVLRLHGPGVLWRPVRHLRRADPNPPRRLAYRMISTLSRRGTSSPITGAPGSSPAMSRAPDVWASGAGAGLPLAHRYIAHSPPMTTDPRVGHLAVGRPCLLRCGGVDALHDYPGHHSARGWSSSVEAGGLGHDRDRPDRHRPDPRDSRSCGSCLLRPQALVLTQGSQPNSVL